MHNNLEHGVWADTSTVIIVIDVWMQTRCRLNLFKIDYFEMQEASGCFSDIKKEYNLFVPDWHLYCEEYSNLPILK